MTLKELINRIIDWNPYAMISMGLILIFISMLGFAWYTWPDGFTGLMGTIGDLGGQLLRVLWCSCTVDVVRA